MTAENQNNNNQGSNIALNLLVLLLLAGLIGFGGYFWVYQNQNLTPKVQAISREAVVTKIQQLNRLETMSYTVDTVITSKREGTWQLLWQDKQKGMFIARGRVVAGVDLSQLNSDMVQVQEPTAVQIAEAQKQAEVNGNINTAVTVMPNIAITLPPSQIFTVYLDDIEVYDWQAGAFGMLSADPAILAEAQKSAKAEVLKRACEDGVMNKAEQSAKNQITQLFSMTGATVTVTTQGAGQCQPVDVVDTAFS